MKLSQTGEDLIKGFETLAFTAYKGDDGIWTCGGGHTGADVVEGTTCDSARAEQWFQRDTAGAVAGVMRTVDVLMTQNQFDALVSFTFNVGVGSEAHSTLVQLLNNGHAAQAAQEFLKWDHIHGVESAGLLRRRTAEQALFLGDPNTA